jgi:hypothetical protein
VEEGREGGRAGQADTAPSRCGIVLSNRHTRKLSVLGGSPAQRWMGLNLYPGLQMPNSALAQVCLDHLPSQGHPGCVWSLWPSLDPFSMTAFIRLASLMAVLDLRGRNPLS